jgi:hypothetical protein
LIVDIFCLELHLALVKAAITFEKSKCRSIEGRIGGVSLVPPPIVLASPNPAD